MYSLLRSIRLIKMKFPLLIFIFSKSIIKCSVSVNYHGKQFVTMFSNTDLSAQHFHTNSKEYTAEDSGESETTIISTDEDDTSQFLSTFSSEQESPFEYSKFRVNKGIKQYASFTPRLSSRAVSPKSTINVSQFPISGKKNFSLQVTDLKCYISLNEGMFFATMIGDFQSAPVIHGVDYSSDCKITCYNKNKCILDFQSKDIIFNCGVHRCGSDSEVMLCISLRIPTIPKLVLPEDVNILLQCHPQATLISQTKQIRISPKEITGRMANTKTKIVATGGNKPHFSSQIALFRHGSNGFTRKVTSGDFIVLGEELLLQSSVNPGDGWKYSRLNDVAVHRIIDNKGIKSLIDSVLLVDSNGCRNPKMIHISPWHPSVDPQNDLQITFLFRAFMFDGMKEGDELVISVQLIACVLQHHCKFKSDLCDKNETTEKLRKRRNTENDTAGWTEDLTFKIIFNEHGGNELLKPTNNNVWILTSLVAGGLFFTLLSFLILYIFNVFVYTNVFCFNFLFKMPRKLYKNSSRAHERSSR